MHMSASQPASTRRLTGFYLGALSTVALLLLLGQFVIQLSFQQQSDYASVINIAGRQRMLSQELCKAGLLIYASADLTMYQSGRKELRATLLLWEKVQEGLVHGDAELGLPKQSSPTVTALFVRIQPSYLTMRRAVQALLLMAQDDARPSVRSRLFPILQQLLATQPVYLKQMNAIVGQYQREAEQSIAQLQRQELALLAVTLSVLLLVGLFAFRPATEKLKRAVAELQRLHQELQQQHHVLNVANGRLETLAFTDPLTGLGNHSAYQEHLARAVAEASQESPSLVLAVLDIDEFKVINDEQGHQRSDDILCALATLLREANLSSALFRLSADDFAVIVPRTTLAETTIALEQLCENIRSSLFDVTVSVGVTHADSHRHPIEELQAQAMLALQEAKRQGRNRVVTFEAIEGEAAFVPLAKRQAVRRLLSERNLTVAFQPIWDLATGTVLAFEALTRPAASYGLSGPQELFDIAEQMGRVHELDAICVEKILARAGELPPDALLFINLSPQSLVHDLLTGAILLEAVISAGLEPSRVVLEITERSIVKLAEVVQKAKFLRRMGFRIALDDAGAGNAGLEMLSQLSVDFVKIDRAVVANALTNQATRSVFVGITTIARESHISVVAEGIENAEILEFVQQAEVRYAQGYLLGRPSETIPAVSALQDLSPLTYTGSH